MANCQWTTVPGTFYRNAIWIPESDDSKTSKLGDKDCKGILAASEINGKLKLQYRSDSLC